MSLRVGADRRRSALSWIAAVVAMGCGSGWAEAAPASEALAAQADPLPRGSDSIPLPLAAATVPASPDECAVWRRERSFARSVEAHDAIGFASHVHPGAVFDAGTADATRGRDAIVASWKDIVDGHGVVLRWRPGVVDIGGDPSVAVSRGPYVLQTSRDGRPAAVSVGLYQTVWHRDADGVWRVLFDGSASAPRPVDDSAAAEAWVRQQTMSDCASS